MLTDDMIRALYATKTSQKARPSVPKAAQLSSSEAGSFFGNVGSLRRSRKGRTYRAANGFRKYNGLDCVAYYLA